jgi:hypothetical protein
MRGLDRRCPRPHCQRSCQLLFVLVLLDIGLLSVPTYNYAESGAACCARVRVRANVARYLPWMFTEAKIL